MRSILTYLICILFVLIVFTNFSQASAYVEVNGVRLWYESIGSGEVIVFIAGGPGFSHVYLKPHFNPLARKFKLIYYDAVGRGRSDEVGAANYSIERDVADLEGLREALNIDKWHVYGHSYGGIVAQQYALKYQDRLYSLILSNTMHSGEMWQRGCDNYYNEIQNQYPESWNDIQQAAKYNRTTLFPQMPNISIPTMPLIYFYDISNLKNMQTDSLPWNETVYYSIVGRDILSLSRELQSLDFRPHLYKINVPILILAGRFDRMAMPRYEIQYLDFIPHAEFYMFEKSGHFPFLEESRENIRVIQDFLLRQQE